MTHPHTDKVSRVLIVSPVRNEAKHIGRVIEAVAAQTRPPDLWVIADDNSDDDTLEILREFEPRVPFLRVMEIPPPEQAAGKDRLAQALELRAFNLALAKVDEASFSHIGKLDGDMEIPPNCIERLLTRMSANPRLGITGASFVERTKLGLTKQTGPRHHVNGAMRIYTRDCFEISKEIRDQVVAWDMIDEAYARMRGFQTERDLELEAIHHRAAGSADGKLRGSMRNGQYAYLSHYSFLWVLARSTRLSVQRTPRVISGLAYLWGYVRCFLERTERVADQDLRRFVRGENRQRLKDALGIGRPAPR